MGWRGELDQLLLRLSHLLKLCVVVGLVLIKHLLFDNFYRDISLDIIDLQVLNLFDPITISFRIIFKLLRLGYNLIFLRFFTLNFLSLLTFNPFNWR